MKKEAIETLSAYAKANKTRKEYQSVRGTPATRQDIEAMAKENGVELPKEEMKGLGDLVAKVIKKTTGIEAKEDCGCKKRQAALNKWVPFHKKKQKK